MADPVRKRELEPEEQQREQYEKEPADKLILKRYNIAPDLMAKIEEKYPGITAIAAEPSKHPHEREKAYLQLLSLVKETIQMNEKTMPYEVPVIPAKLPRAVAEMMFPDFDFEKYEKEADKRLGEYIEYKKHEDESKRSYRRFIDEEEAKLSGKKLPPAVPSRRPEKVEDVVSSVKEDLWKNLKDEAGEELSDEEIEVVEEMPPTKREGDRKAS